MGLVEWFSFGRKEEPGRRAIEDQERPISPQRAEEYATRLELIRISLRNIPDLYLNLQHTRTGDHNINALFTKAEGIAARMTELLAPLLTQLRALANNIRKNLNPEARTNQVEMIATKVTELNSLRLTLEPALEDILAFLKEAIGYSSAAMQDAAALNRKDLVAGILRIERQFEEERDKLTTLRRLLNETIGFYSAIMGKNIASYRMAIEKECQKPNIFNSLKLVEGNLQVLFLKKASKTITKLLQLRPQVSTIVTTI